MNLRLEFTYIKLYNPQKIDLLISFSFCCDKGVYYLDEQIISHQQQVTTQKMLQIHEIELYEAGMR